MRRFAPTRIVLVILLSVACVGRPPPEELLTPAPAPATPTSAQPKPGYAKVMVIVEENHQYGRSSGGPTLRTSTLSPANSASQRITTPATP